MSSSINSKFFKLLSNKYVLTILAILAWMTFFDDNNLLHRLKAKRQIYNLEKEIDRYNREIEDNNNKINNMKTDNAGLERFAREHYYMSRPNEDVYIIED